MGVDGLADGRDHGLAVLRGQDNAAYAGGDLAVDDVDLGLRLVFLERTIPVDIDGDALPGFQFCGAAQGAAMDRLPEFMRQSLGDDSNPVFEVLLGPAAAAGQSGEQGQADR